MIKWSNNMFLSEAVKDRDLRKIKTNLNNNKKIENLYCITFASNPENLFDIYNAKQLIKPYFQKTTIHILGLAESKEAAYNLVTSILLEVLKSTGDLKVREYFS